MSTVTPFDIIRPGDQGYSGVQHVYSATGSPAAVVRPRRREDVPAALAFAREQPGPLAIRSGGHGISSISTNTGGTVIDLGLLSGIERLDDRHVRLGPGAHWGRVAQELYPWGLAISSGDSGDVGVGGLGTTGGIGLMGRAHGLTIDSLVAAEIVTADGGTLHLSATENPDLFWAVRGAGANMGVVTSFDFRAAPTPVVVRATIAYGQPDAPGFLKSWGRLLESSPRAISAFLYLGGSPAFAQATVVYAGDDTREATRALEPFLALPGVVGSRAEVVPYASIPQSSNAPHTGQQQALAHTGLADHLNEPIAAGILALLRTRSADMVQIRSTGGAINDVPADGTAYAHRHQNFSITAIAMGRREGFDSGWEPLRREMDGIYLSFESDHRPDDVARAFPPPTLAKLRAIKHEWDPERVFVQNFDLSAA